MILNMFHGSGGDTPVVGTPTVVFKDSAVTAHRTSDSVISFSGLSVSEGEILIGVSVRINGVVSPTGQYINHLYVFQNGEEWVALVGGADRLITQTSQISFVKSGETGGTITMTNQMVFSALDNYYIRPIVAIVS